MKKAECKEQLKLHLTAGECTTCKYARGKTHKCYYRCITQSKERVCPTGVDIETRQLVRLVTPKQMVPCDITKAAAYARMTHNADPRKLLGLI